MKVIAFSGSARKDGSTAILINQMIIPGSNYWNIGVGLDKGDVKKDEEGIVTMKTLGENMAWLLTRTSHRPSR